GRRVRGARHTLAKFLLKEVTRTLDEPTAEEVKGELIELGLWTYIRDFLPAGRRPARRTNEEASSPGPRLRPDPEPPTRPVIRRAASQTQGRTEQTPLPPHPGNKFPHLPQTHAPH